MAAHVLVSSLRVGVGGNRALRSGARRHQPQDDEGGQRRFADPMTARNRPPDRRDRIPAVEGAQADLPADFLQLLALPFIGAGEVL
jgi:hypothetical protein